MKRAIARGEKMIVNKRISGSQSGFVVGTRAYYKRWEHSISVPTVEEWLLADASTPSPNFRASEMFLHLVAGSQYPSNFALAFIGHGGTLSEYQTFWNDVEVLPDTYWREFYSNMRNIQNVWTGFAPAFLMQGITTWREQMLGMAKTALNLPGKLQVFPLEGISDISILDMPWHGETSLGKVPCPDCSHQRGEVIYHPVRLQKGSYILCKNEHSPKEVGCKGAKAWKNQKAWELPLQELVQLTGLRLSGKFIYKLFCICSLAPDAALLIRDYSNSRGTVESIVDSWPTAQLAITTAIYIKNTAGTDATALELLEGIKQDPVSWSKLIKEFPLFSTGEIWEIILD